MDWDLGSIPEWFALAGGLAAAGAFILGRRDLRQADAASLYLMVTAYRSGTPSETPNFTKFKITNDSERPAYRVGIAAWSFGVRRWTWRLRRHDHWMTGHRIAGRVYPTVEPRSSVANELPGVDEWGPGGESPPVMLVFRDANGRGWVRWPDGRLTRLYPSLYYLQDRKWRLEVERRNKVIRQRRQQQAGGGEVIHTQSP